MLKQTLTVAVVLLLLNTLILKAQNGPQPVGYAESDFSLPDPIIVKGKLSVGDVMPNITFRNLINYKTTSARLSDFKGKLVILDFWSTTCSSCIGAFPKMDTLQNKFKDEIQVILVNTSRMKDTPEKVKKAFDKVRNNTGYEVGLPYMIGDTVLENYISFRYIPHHVWINGKGKIVAVTSGQEVTEENVRAFVDGDEVKIRYKKDDLIYDNNKPLFMGNNGDPGNAILHRSTITRYVEGLGFYSGKIADYNVSTFRYSCINNSLIKIFHDAFNVFSYPINRWVFETSKADMFSLSETKELNNTYCYELIANADSKEGFKSLMQADLKNYFKVNVTKELRSKEVYLLQAKKRKKDELNSLPLTSGNGRTIKFAAFIKTLNRIFDKPVFDNTKFPFNNIIVPHNFDSYNINAAREVLSDLGLTLQDSRRKIEVLVFKDI